ncbi:metallophosphoesterase family protein [Flavobacterium sp. ZB4P13]|uniref:metallophosphoesterase family protein n=1 Tax=Flavobacterium sp. ZB4P13 TaxID=3401728 RepID=UPI003AB10056
MKRRDLLKYIGLTVGTVALSGTTSIVSAAEQRDKRKRVLRIAHITDVHIRPEENAPNRFVKCLEEIKKHKVDFFLNGGDTIFAADYDTITRERVNELWKVWNETTRGINDFEIHSCLGNHDMWWAAPDKKDPMYGKDYVVKQLGIPNRYYSFDKKGWHFVILDSNNGGGSLDDEQRLWLEKDLQAIPTGTPVICMSHYPILAACTHVDGGNHTDSKYISDLFYKHKDKKINCFSGHIHLLDNAVYNNIHYYCNGALSGFWWEAGDKDSAGKTYYKQTPPGYAIVDLFEDGSVDNQYFPHSF